MSGLKTVIASAGLVLGLSVSGAEAQSTTHGCACIANNTNGAINYRYKWGDQAWQTHKLQPHFQSAMCWQYTDAHKSSPVLLFQLDVDMTAGNAWTTFNLPRHQATAGTCQATPKAAHYDINYRPNTNNQFIQVTHR